MMKHSPAKTSKATINRRSNIFDVASMFDRLIANDAHTQDFLSFLTGSGSGCKMALDESVHRKQNKNDFTKSCC